ncbi:TlpA family protein disulfide reductase [Vreelandella sp.]|uniref:TlpA family protein disulfide reductase n=1 Tax=Vreelandella sp. TaxID=3137778 RepID=UPI003BACDCC6
MNAIALGPLLISTPRLYAFGCALLLLLGSRYLLGLPAKPHGRWFNGLLVAWLLGARVVFVALHWESYSATPVDAIKLWQPGYNALGGLLAGLAWTAWALREHLLAMLGGLAMTVGAASLWLVMITLAPLGQSLPVASLPDATLEDLEGNEIHLTSLANQGDLIIVNLWATWCPPCLREMPLLAEADQQEGVSVVVVNQGEDLLPIARYLDEQSLVFRYPLRDPQQTLMAQFQAPGLPTTVLFDQHGKTLDVHVGELTRAQLESWLND